MKVFLDTSVLVSAFVYDHVQHTLALPIVESVETGKTEGFTSGHAVLEVYSVLTRLPAPSRIRPAEAKVLIQENILKTFKVVALTGKEYADLTLRMGTEGIAGGQAYDALHLECAVKCGADRIYTFNQKHFQNLAGASVRARIVSP